MISAFSIRITSQSSLASSRDALNARRFTIGRRAWIKILDESTDGKDEKHSIFFYFLPVPLVIPTIYIYMYIICYRRTLPYYRILVKRRHGNTREYNNDRGSEIDRRRRRSFAREKKNAVYVYTNKSAPGGKSFYFYFFQFPKRIKYARWPFTGFYIISHVLHTVYCTPAAESSIFSRPGRDLCNTIAL